DNTVAIAKREGAQVIETREGKFKDWRNAGLTAAHGDWVLYVDADERVTPKLAKEIEDTIERTSYSAFALSRHNIQFGKWFQHGGWEKDVVVRLFKRSQLREWQGDVHESAKVEGNQGLLTESLVHFTHRDLLSGLVKSAMWTDTEARLLYEAGVKPVGVVTLIRKPFMEFFRRLILKKGYKDGIEGWIESIQQAMNRFFVYERLWELQSKPTLSEKYQRFESEIQKMWEASSSTRGRV
ncbi:MAG TPA: glycosyltransferase family 2 protein, partial [Patescibacteria group bacterium]|nr:glycosyltransferase family 2 protein [Patescibacteria group bacterium]